MKEVPNNHNIELEIRAEISPKKFGELLGRLGKMRKATARVRRLSVMFLGEIGEEKIDLRVRIDSNGNVEIVIKKGNFHSADRVEVSQKIIKDEFIGLVRILSVFGFKGKITERENFIYKLTNRITVTLVRTGSIGYLEIEKMSTPRKLRSDKKELIYLAKQLNLNLIKNRKEFDDLCNRLSKKYDLSFTGSKKEMTKLKELLSKY